jgi:hypothetical protein
VEGEGELEKENQVFLSRIAGTSEADRKFDSFQRNSLEIDRKAESD